MDTANEILPLAERAARRAGRVQLENLRSSFSIDSKSSAVDMVTEIDTKSESLIEEEILEKFPDHIILGEESETVSKTDTTSSDYTWVIDPLDGTTNFVHGLPIFAVSIAFYHRDEALVGLVYIPPFDTIYSAVRGKGAYKNKTPISVAQHDRLDHSLIATGVPYDRASSSDNNVKYISHLTPKVRGIRRLGAAAYDLCLVAEGVYDAYWEMKVELWDIAAGMLICSEAGAVTKAFPFSGKYNVLTSTPSLYPALCRELQQAGDDFEKACNEQ